jgi:hypothetical protein
MMVIMMIIIIICAISEIGQPSFCGTEKAHYTIMLTKSPLVPTLSQIDPDIPTAAMSKSKHLQEV